MNIEHTKFYSPETMFLSNQISHTMHSQNTYNQQHISRTQISQQLQISVIQILQDQQQQHHPTCCNDPIQQQIPDIVFIQFENSNKKPQSNFIKSALKKIYQNRKNKNKKKNKSCGICLNEMIEDACKLQCKHSFCRDCLMEWFTYSFKCPYCRKQSDYYLCGKEVKKTNRPILIEDNDEDAIENVQQHRPFNQFCYICNIQQPNCLLIVCNRCGQRACHPSCDENFEQIISRYFRWYCNYCR